MGHRDTETQRQSWEYQCCLAVVAIATCVASGCDRSDVPLLPPPGLAPLASAQCASPDSADYYFGPGQINASGDDSFQRGRWFKSYLAAAGARPLSCGEPTEAYRVSWLPSSRNAKIVTLARSDGYWTLESVDFGKQLHGGASGEPPPLTRESKALTTPELERIRRELSAIDFWSAPQYRSNAEIDDGTALVVEGRSGDRYRAITRINQWDGTERVACALFQIADLPLPDHPRCPEP